nr:MAG TPA: hypothetical protein [Caudoviricetes sp.]DAT34084.1 MAG TPA: hypothetical protein [Caudoviricetes sp.]
MHRLVFAVDHTLKLRLHLDPGCFFLKFLHRNYGKLRRRN